MKFNPLSKDSKDKSVRRHMLKSIDTNYSAKSKALKSRTAHKGNSVKGLRFKTDAEDREDRHRMNSSQIQY